MQVICQNKKIFSAFNEVKRKCQLIYQYVMARPTGLEPVTLGLEGRFIKRSVWSVAIYPRLIQAACIEPQ